MGRVFTCSNAANKSLDVVAVIDIQVVKPIDLKRLLYLSVGAAQLSLNWLHAAVVLSDGHLVVVEDDDKVAVQLAGNIQALKRLPRTWAVADNCDDVLLAALWYREPLPGQAPD